MGLRTPSKIILAKGFVNQPYYVRYITHGGGIKFSSIEKRINSKGMFSPQGYDAVSYLGIVGANEITNFPHTPPGSEARLLRNLPNPVVSEMKMDVDRLKKQLRLSEGVYLTAFVYKYKKVR